MSQKFKTFTFVWPLEKLIRENLSYLIFSIVMFLLLIIISSHGRPNEENRTKMQYELTREKGRNRASTLIASNPLKYYFVLSPAPLNLLANDFYHWITPKTRQTNGLLYIWRSNEKPLKLMMFFFMFSRSHSTHVSKPDFLIWGGATSQPQQFWTDQFAGSFHSDWTWRLIFSLSQKHLPETASADSLAQKIDSHFSSESTSEKELWALNSHIFT